MKTKNYEKKTIVTHAYCECGGELLADTTELFLNMITGNGKFKHICNKCNKIEMSDKLYPDENCVEVEINAEVN